MGDVRFVGAHPAAYAGVEVVEVLDDHGAAVVFAVRADRVEGDDEGVAVVGEVRAEPAGGCEWEQGAVEQLCADGADDRAVGADEGAVGVEGEFAQDVHGVAVAATGGDDDFGASFFGGAKGGEVARADAGVGAEEGAIHVDGDEAGTRHRVE